jgi:hypothetical protein
LISNALNYKAEIDPRIHVAAVQEHGEWVFSISDNGLGIPLEHRASIFGVFTRLHAVKSPDQASASRFDPKLSNCIAAGFGRKAILPNRAAPFFVSSFRLSRL